jgi:hypothetical protein
LADDSKVALDICSEIGATGCKIYYTDEKTRDNPQETHFVELDVIGSELLSRPDSDTNAVASYCAAQLFKRLKPETISKNYGYNIIFDGKNDILNSKKYFYKNDELKRALKSFDNIDIYLKSIINGDTASAFSCIDTNFFSLDIPQLNNKVKNRIGTSIIKTKHFFAYYDYTNKSNTKTTKCFNIVTIITKKDSCNIQMRFLTPITENNKIITFDPGTE